MKSTIEISIYPLTESYEKVVLDFISRLRSHPQIEVETNGLSTQIFGDFDFAMPLLHAEIKWLWKTHKAVVLLKMGKGELRFKDPA